MSPRPVLHVLFTMNCEPPASKSIRQGPKNWDGSARSIEGFVSRLEHAALPATLFVAPRCAEEQAPLLDDLRGRGVEIGLHVHPAGLESGRFTRNLGQYSAEQQTEIIALARDQAEEALGSRLTSFRSANYSANDATYRVLYDLGFRQGSLSNPGRDRPGEAAVWLSAEQDPHYVDPNNRLGSGTLPFLEIPVTTDTSRETRSGLNFELVIEGGSWSEWLSPIIEADLKRITTSSVFPTLSVVTHNAVPYHLQDVAPGEALDELVAYIERLHEDYDIIPLTLSQAHERFRRVVLPGLA